MTRGAFAALAAACALLMTACTNTRQVGSACEDNICDTVAPSSRIPCVIATGMRRVMGDAVPMDEQCLPDRVYKDENDMAPCRVLFSIGTPDFSCDDFDLSPSAESDTGRGTLCELPQLSLEERQSTSGPASGWYLLDPSPADPLCAGFSHRLILNGLLPATGVAWLTCAEALATPGVVSDALREGEEPLIIAPESCVGLPPLPALEPPDVGAVCETRFGPAEGFHTTQTYVDLRSAQCETGVCLVDATQSSSPWPCDGFCPEPSLAELTYCSCRCNARGDDSRSECRCPPDFTCADVLSVDAPASVAGGYCVRRSSLQF